MAPISSPMPDQYLPNLQADGQWLMQAQKDSLWDYGARRSNRVDHSTTQYGILGLWEVSKRGGNVPNKIWEDAVKHFVQVQKPDGGWTYNLSQDARV